MSWARLRGHEALIRSFEQAFRRGRLGHAFLFVGPEGVGKKGFAIELAKTLLCGENSGRFEACDRCPDCLQIEAGAHPDFQLLGLPEQKHEFPVELMHEAIRHLALKPARGRYRACIVDDADQFNEEAANAFLKTLEEPPPASLLILVGTSADRQLPTILSRCQIIRFTPLTPDVIAEQLLQEGVVAKADEAERLAKLSAGSLGEARALADPALEQFRRTLLDGLSQPRVDSVGLAADLVKFVEEAGKESAVRRQRAKQVLRFLIDFLRAGLLTQLGYQPPFADPRDAQAVRRLAERLAPQTLHQLLERSLEADYQVDRRVQLVLVLEALIDALGERLHKAG